MHKDFELTYISKDGKIKQWPKKVAAKIFVLEHVLKNFQLNIEYPHEDFNRIIAENILFDDVAIIRREFCDRGYVVRPPDGRYYIVRHYNFDNISLDKK